MRKFKKVDRYELVFHGDMLAGFDTNEAKDKLIEVFDLPPSKQQTLFLRPTCLKTQLTLDEARVYQEQIAPFGIKTVLEPAREEPEAMPEIEKPEGGKGAPVSLAKGESGELEQSSEPAGEQRVTPLVDGQRHFPFEFLGDGFEYFKIWIVNLVLTILTLGIYSAWAKVRNKQYFYGNTRLDGASFQYLARPLAILKGRVIGMALLILYVILAQFNELFGVLFMLVLMLVFPMLAVRALAFNARYTAYRNVRFDFKGSYGQSYLVFLVWPLIAGISVGLLWPLAIYHQQRYIIENSYYGTSRFEFAGEALNYFGILFLGIVFAIVGMVLWVVAILAGVLLSKVLPEVVGPIVGLLIIALSSMALFLFITAYFTVNTTNLLLNSSAIASNRIASTMETLSYSLIYLVNSIGNVLTLGLFYPWAMVRIARYRAERTEVLAREDLGTFVAGEEQKSSAYGEEINDIFDMDVV